MRTGSQGKNEHRPLFCIGVGLHRKTSLKNGTSVKTNFELRLHGSRHVEQYCVAFHAARLTFLPGTHYALQFIMLSGFSVSYRILLSDSNIIYVLFHS